jgi:hypothetical protein
VTKSVAARDNFGGFAWRRQTREANGAIIDGMEITPFNSLTAKGRLKVITIREGIEVAARYFIYTEMARRDLLDRRISTAVCTANRSVAVRSSFEESFHVRRARYQA